MKTIILVLVLLAVVGGGYYLVHKPSGSAYTEESNTAAQTQASTTPSASGGKFTGSLAELAARGGSWQCTVDSTAGGAVSSGTTYVSGKNVRADFTTKVAGYSVDSHLIADGSYTYSWTSMTNAGIKAKQQPAAQSNTTGAPSGQGVSANTSYSYDCQPWSADQAKFTIPASISFKLVN